MGTSEFNAGDYPAMTRTSILSRGGRGGSRNTLSQGFINGRAWGNFIACGHEFAWLFSTLGF